MTNRHESQTRIAKTSEGAHHERETEVGSGHWLHSADEWRSDLLTHSGRPDRTQVHSPDLLNAICANARWGRSSRCLFDRQDGGPIALDTAPGNRALRFVVAFLPATPCSISSGH